MNKTSRSFGRREGATRLGKEITRQQYFKRYLVQTKSVANIFCPQPPTIKKSNDKIRKGTKLSQVLSNFTRISFIKKAAL